MSIAIQKKRLNKQTSADYNCRVSEFSSTNPHHDKYFKTLSDFESNFKRSASHATLKNTKTLLEGFYKALKSDEFFLTDLAKHGDRALNNAENIFLVHKASDIVMILADDVVNRRSIQPRKRSFDFDFLDKMSSETRDITLLSVKILKLFSIINAHFASLLSNKPHFCVKMFDLLLQDKKVYFKQVLSILEAMIAANSSIVNSLLYPHMHEVLVNMPKKYFARFSRIIALIVLENAEKIDLKELSSSYTENKMIKIHSFLLSIPNIIEIYALILEYLREIAEKMMLTTPKTARKSIRFLKETNLIKESGLNLSFLKPLFEQAPISENIAKEIFTPKFIIKFIVKKSNLTEILFVISNLLSGKRKIEVQDRLCEINFIDRVVHPMFDLLFHPDLDAEINDEADNCNSNNPLATARIQLLRTIINFCDRDSPNTDNKILLLSAEEQSILYSKLIQKALNVHCPSSAKVPLGQSPTLSRLISRMTSEQHIDNTFFDDYTLKENMFEHVERKGLLNKIITLFNRFHPNSNYRFWLASCVESFLRGFHEAHQIFVAHTGLLYNLLNQILNKQISKANNVQISYDLVGEIVKFNKYNMIFLEKLCETFGWTAMLSEQAFVNVVDSNVFLRALLLSKERFDYDYQKEEDEEMKEKLKNSTGLLRMNQLFVENNMQWFHQIIESIDPNLVNQDNICCINTLLIVAIFADQKGKLEEYIELLAKKKGKNEKGKETLQNLNSVLGVWDRYYMSKTKDSFSLEYTSSLPFYQFQEIKRRLQGLLEEKIEKL